MNENPSHTMDAKVVHGGLYPDHQIFDSANAHPVHHTHPTTMQLPGQIDKVHGGGNNGGDPQMLVSVEAQHVQNYTSEQDHGVHHSNGRDGMEEDQDGAVESEGMEGDVPPDAANLGIIAAPGPGNQLTLSFQGEVYVFDSVSPEKVQAVLLLLGGRELTSGGISIPSSSHQISKRSNFPQRVASLMRFREKRKERNFDKKIRYNVRKEVALRMQRNKGQFTSSKSKPEDATLGVTSWDATQRWGVVDNRPQAASACHHCGINSKSTPMMRRGPDGPRTLCNACGLMWANKGTLRDLSKNAAALTQSAGNNTSSNLYEGNEATEEADGQQPLVITANGHDSSSSS